MIKNPNFEGITSPGGWTRDVWGHAPIPEIYSPEEWIVFFYEDVAQSIYQPEIHVIERVEPFLDPPRQHAGNWSVKAFKTSGRIDCGLLQHVRGLTPGASYTFAYWAHGWSLHTGVGPCTDHDDPHCSSGVGVGGHYILASDAPALSGDPVNDAISNMFFKAGARPGPREDPFAGGITWGEGAYIYNVYARVPTVTFTASAGGEAVLFMRVQARWPFRHNDAYFDLAELSLVPDGVNPPDVREQYDKRAILLKHDVRGKDWAQVVVNELWDSKGVNITSSADDALGPNSLDSRSVLAVNPQDWTGKSEDLVAFRDEHYPNAVLDAVELATPADLQAYLRGEEPNRWEQYLLTQRDPQWAGEDLAFDCDLTIGVAGCYLTNEAMAQRIYNINPTATPVTVRNDRGPTGFSKCDARRDQADETLGFEEFIAGQDTVDAHLAAGGVAMAEVLPTDKQHFVLIVEKLPSGDYLMLDPWHGVVAPIKDKYLGWESFRMMVKVEAPVPEPQPYTMLGYHLQRAFYGWLDHVGHLHNIGQPLKWVFFVAEGMENIHRVRERSPGTKGVYRLVLSQEEQGVYLTWALKDPIKAATHYWNRFAQSALTNQIDAVVSLNETFGMHGLEDIRKTVAFDVAFCQVVQEQSDGTIAPVVLVAPPANPDHGAEVEMLTPAARACVDAGGYIGAHTYFPATPDRDRVLRWIREEGLHYHLRPQLSWDPVFRAAGVHPRYLGLEAGAVAAHIRQDGRPGGFRGAEAGWRGPTSLAGDLTLYAECLAEVDALKRNWNVKHNHRVEFEGVFSSGYVGWEKFQVNEDEWPVIYRAVVPGW